MICPQMHSRIISCTMLQDSLSEISCQIHCWKYQNELLLDPGDPTTMTVESYPVYAKFTHSKQKGGLVFPFPAVLKIVKATEVVCKRRVIDKERGINIEKMLDLKFRQ